MTDFVALVASVEHVILNLVSKFAIIFPTLLPSPLFFPSFLLHHLHLPSFLPFLSILFFPPPPLFLSFHLSHFQASDALIARPAIANLTANNKASVICLHSKVKLPLLQQAYDRSPPGHRKIILATDIAETSVTIDDVTIVIDSGKCRERPYYESGFGASAASFLYKVRLNMRDERRYR